MANDETGPSFAYTSLKNANISDIKVIVNSDQSAKMAN
jgi:hypothetical protein